MENLIFTLWESPIKLQKQGIKTHEKNLEWSWQGIHYIIRWCIKAVAAKSFFDFVHYSSEEIYFLCHENHALAKKKVISFEEGDDFLKCDFTAKKPSFVIVTTLPHKIFHDFTFEILVEVSQFFVLLSIRVIVKKLVILLKGQRNHYRFFLFLLF